MPSSAIAAALVGRDARFVGRQEFDRRQRHQQQAGIEL
jgi:hypothetical protein